MKTVLHVGSGGSHLPKQFQHCKEVTLDIDPNVNPDIVASMVDLPENIGPFDALYACHCLEHIYPHEVDQCLSGFLRVLKPQGGVAIILVPDLEDVKPTEDVVYVSPAGPVTGLDMIYGFRPALPFSLHMAHHNGFTEKTLRAALERNGFVEVQVARASNDCFGLYAIGVRP